MADYDGEGFSYVMSFFCTCFTSSIVVVFLLISGLPLNNRVCLTLLSLLALSLSVSILTLSLAYAGFLYHIMPEGVYHTTHGLVLWPLYLLITLITAILFHDI